MVREHIEDTVLALFELDAEPRRRFGFFLDQRLRVAEKLLDFPLLARLRLEGKEREVEAA
ncbi:MAG: hypothetical protein LH702_27110 [Phormidesmis sp. CAN_BIN44]|nr:hypothetical protein [Phormidesmis sp. CAN_BIN44]